MADRLASRAPATPAGHHATRRRFPQTAAGALWHRVVRRGRIGVLYLVLGLAVVVTSITIALLVTPAQQVHTFGQTLKVGATAPSLSWSGPGQLDLFGQELPTAIRFDGPVRPRLALTHITLGNQVSSLFGGGAANLHRSEQRIGDALAAGWTRYFVWEVAITAAAALLLVGALCGWARLSWRRTLVLCAGGLVAVEAVNVGAIMATVYTAPAKLRHIPSLESLVGRGAHHCGTASSRPGQAVGRRCGHR